MENSVSKFFIARIHACVNSRIVGEYMEYVKYFWKYNDEETPVLVFVELDEERYSTRQIEVFPDRHMEIMGAEEMYVSEEPYPSNEEINAMGEFRIYNILQKEFENVWNGYLGKYRGNLEFPSEC